MFFLGRCTVQPTIVQGPPQFIPGVPDTVYLPNAPISGHSYNSHSQYTATLDTVYVMAAFPELVETVVTDTMRGTLINIRASAYPWLDNDTLRINQVVEYNVIPAPRPVITIHDTIPYPVSTPAEVPWIEQPATVATGVSIGWIAILILLL